MVLSDSEFFKELLSMFKMESEEHINAMVSGINKLEKTAPSDEQMTIAETVHRAAHSLKGAARTIGLVDVEPICQSLESIFSTLKKQKMSLPPEIFDMLNRVVDGLGKLLASLDDEGKISGDRSELMRLIDEINSQVALIGSNQ